MESKTIKLRFREDTAENWKLANPILASSEPAREIDTGKIKYGDGTTKYNDLPYFISDSIEDVPSDNKLYGRKDKKWSEIIIPESIDDAPSDDKIYGRKNKVWTEIESSTPSGSCGCGDIKTISSTQINGVTQEENGYSIASTLTYNTTTKEELKEVSNTTLLPLSVDNGITSIIEGIKVKARLNEEVINAINQYETEEYLTNDIKEICNEVYTNNTDIISINFYLMEDLGYEYQKMRINLSSDGSAFKTTTESDKATITRGIYNLTFSTTSATALECNGNGFKLILNANSNNIYITPNTNTTTEILDGSVDIITEIRPNVMVTNYVMCMTKRKNKKELGYYHQLIEGTSIWNLPLETFTDETSIKDYFANNTLEGTTTKLVEGGISGVDGSILAVQLIKKESNMSYNGILLLYDDTTPWEEKKTLFEGQYQYYGNYVYVKGNIGYAESSIPIYSINVSYLYDGKEIDKYTTTLQGSTETSYFTVPDGYYASKVVSVINGKYYLDIDANKNILGFKLYDITGDVSMVVELMEKSSAEYKELGVSTINLPLQKFTSSSMVKTYFDKENPELKTKLGIAYSTDNLPTNSTLIFTGNLDNITFSGIIFEGSTFEEVDEIFKKLNISGVNYYYYSKNIIYAEVKVHTTTAFNFYIDDTQYTAQAIDGVNETWKDWASSERNTIGAIAYSDNELSNSTKDSVLQIDGKNIGLPDTIIEGGKYYFAKIESTETSNQYDIIGKDYSLVTYESESKQGVFKKDNTTNELTQIYSSGVNWQGVLANTSTDKGEQTSTNYVCFHNNTQEILLYNVAEEKFINIKTDKIYVKFEILCNYDSDTLTLIPYRIVGKTDDEQYSIIIILEDSSYTEYPVIKIMNNAGGYREVYNLTSFAELTKEQNISSLNTDYFFNLDIDGKTYVGSKSQEDVVTEDGQKQKQTTTWVLLNSNEERVLIDAEYVPGTYTLEKYGDVVIEQ